MTWSRRRRNSARNSATNGSPCSSAARAAYCETTGAQVTSASCTLRMSVTRSAGPCRKPTRQPVMPYAFEKEHTRTTRSRAAGSIAALKMPWSP